MSPVTNPTPFWSGETLLLGWGETSTRGRTVTLLLPEDDEQHPFRDLAVKQGKRSGQRMMAVFVLLGDDEQPVEPRLSQRAAALCRDPGFWSWATDVSGIWDRIASEEAAKRFMYEQLGIDSRSKLDTDDRAASLFRVMEAKFRDSISIFGSKP